MDLVDNIIINGFSVLLLIILCFHSLRRTEEKSIQFTLYVGILVTTMLMLVLDVFSRTDGNLGTLYPVLNHVSNFLLFVMNPIVPSLWLMYIYFQTSHDEEKTKKLILPLIALNVANLLMVIISQFTGWYYFIDSGNIYHRGSLFLVSTIIPLFSVILSCVIISQNKKSIGEKQLFSLMFFPLPPFVGILLQIYIYGISFVLNSIVLSLLIVLLNMQNDTIYSDFLTGVGNRKKLDAVLKDSIKRSSIRRTFSLVMLDIDEFKEINDTFGHEMGDKALKASAELLKKCVRSKDYVVRFGGDEFCLVLELYDKKGLDSIVNRIHSSAEQLNASGEFPFNLKFAVGCAVFDYNSGMKSEDFINQVDILMYENKRLKKSLS